jgi:hypothetical protein
MINLKMVHPSMQAFGTDIINYNQTLPNDKKQ